VKRTAYLVRHGEAENNLVEPPPIYLGAEAKLTDLGKREAELIAKRATRIQVDLLVSSSMTRARQTTAAISYQIDKHILVSDLFVERSGPSCLVGREWRDPEVQRIQKLYEDSCFKDERVLDGENFSDLRQRGMQALQFLEERPEQHIMVVTHGLFLRVLVGCAVYGQLLTAEILAPMEHGFRTRNTGLTMLEYDPERLKSPWSILTWNDYAHLAD